MNPLFASSPRNPRNKRAASRNRRATGPAYAPNIDGRHPAAATAKRESVMQEIIELNLSEIEAVTGGHKTVSAAYTATTARPTLTASTLSAPSFTKPTFVAPSDMTVAARRY
jgi:hypothetical protein